MVRARGWVAMLLSLCLFGTYLYEDLRLYRRLQPLLWRRSELVEQMVGCQEDVRADSAE